MNARTFMHKYFRDQDWEMVSITSYGTEKAYIKLRNGETFVRVVINLNGEGYWTEDNATVDHIEGF